MDIFCSWHNVVGELPKLPVRAPAHSSVDRRMADRHDDHGWPASLVTIGVSSEYNGHLPEKVGCIGVA